ncbi:hypothetical protein NMF83_05600 [Clostridioides difficile]|uniref:hypothetical protein n=1 Tax=Clostridioides difficile TaxID=1496 RepID=UPI000C9997B0|nr:hypothetical protein [Clostridioides difficile]MBY2557797.1 hypothetical protein [Clostridioides difficile]MCP8365770.1 hypothetical protein [Clostridioides difficile]MCP8383315.1 hypothetical protein [Clostridioides difficile]MCR1517866.1 hypothetical protein [Clostridioides difficile]MCW0877852.1 hypothetical protein [Clostridioides difficile]
MKRELNLIPFLAEALSINSKCYSFIDKYYNKDKLKYMNLAKKSIFYNSKIASEGSIIQEYYFKRALGILSSQENRTIFEIYKLGYKAAYNYINSIQIFKVSNFLKKLLTRVEPFTNDELNGNVLVAISLCGELEKDVDISDIVYQRFIENLFLRMDDYKDILSIDNLDKNKRKMLSKIELKLKSMYLKDYIPSSYVINIDSSKNYEDLTFLEKQIAGLDYVSNLEGISIIRVVGKDIFKSKQIQELILSYLKVQGNIEDENSINYEDLFRFIITAIDLRYWAREYKKAKQFFFNNFDEELNEVMKEKEIEIKELKKENLLLQDEKEKLKLELELLQKDKNRLESEIKEQCTSKEELVQLRNFMFNQQQEQEEKVLIDESINLKNIKAIIFGGHPNWILKMKDKLINFEFISADTINFNVNILDSYEYVFINTNYVGHAMYYKIIENLNENNKLRYINNVNVDRAIEDIKNSIKV